MKVTSVGALSMQELRPQEPTKPEAKEVSALNGSQLDTSSQKSKQSSSNNILNLMAEAQKRADERRKTSDKKKRDKVHRIYQRMKTGRVSKDFYGFHLDHEA